MDSTWSNTTSTQPKQSSIYALLSPPKEKRQDSFSSNSAPTMAVTTPNTSFTTDNVSQKMEEALNSSNSPARTPNTNAYLSPVSPQFQDVKKKVSQDDINGAQDPQLFTTSDDGDAGLPADVPLFPRPRPRPVSRENAARIIISAHMQRVASQQSSSSSSAISMPSKADYELVASAFKKMSRPMTMNIMKFVREDPEGFLRRNKAELAMIGKAPAVKKPAPKPTYRRILSAPISKKQRTTNITARPRPVRAAPRQPHVQTFYAHGFEEVKQGPPHTLKAPRPISNREDVEYNSIPDYSPSVSTLGNNAKCLKVEWKGSPLPLDKDPDRHLLHEAEVTAASALRLSCAQYLTSKRRIFAAKLEKLRQGKEFRKTDAQQACKIDVNKASRLWGAFDRVHWFDRAHFQKWL